MSDIETVTQLSPQGARFPVAYRYLPAGPHIDFPHLLEDRHAVMPLTTEEALVFALQLHEIKQVLDTARAAWAFLQDEYQGKATYAARNAVQDPTAWPEYMPQEWKDLGSAIHALKQAAHYKEDESGTSTVQQ